MIYDIFYKFMILLGNENNFSILKMNKHKLKHEFYKNKFIFF